MITPFRCKCHSLRAVARDLLRERLWVFDAVAEIDKGNTGNLKDAQPKGQGAAVKAHVEADGQEDHKAKHNDEDVDQVRELVHNVPNGEVDVASCCRPSERQLEQGLEGKEVKRWRYGPAQCP